MATPTFPGAWSRYDEYPRVDRQQSRWTLKNRRYCPGRGTGTCTSASGDTTRRGFGRRHIRPTLAPRPNPT
jgi:hypothetical protein